uniref:Uncharacterized protein n=1 Tax=Leersia perrieri TaxID=77586 RepID=A0A0D9XPL4_9ORYZ
MATDDPSIVCFKVTKREQKEGNYRQSTILMRQTAWGTAGRRRESAQIRVDLDGIWHRGGGGGWRNIRCSTIQ